MKIWKIRSLFYRIARILGDVQAMMRGPKAVGKRIVRRVVGRAVGRTMRRILK
ncbi:hypothetical protein [Pseudothermotoga sp.]